MPLTVENGILQHKPKKAEIKRLTNDLAKQQHALARKEAELADLRAAVSAEEREISLLTKEVGSRDQRVDLGTLHGGPKAKQVGGEMATAIRRRMLRQQATLREKVNRDKGRLDDDIGYNKRLRREIEQRRLERLNHMQGLRGLRVAHADQFGRRPRARPRRLVPPQDRPCAAARGGGGARASGGGGAAATAGGRARRRRPLCGGDSAAAARAPAREGPDRRAQGDGAVGRPPRADGRGVVG